MSEITTGYELKEWRDKHKISQKKLCKEIGYSIYRISHIESENQELSSKLKDIVNNYAAKFSIKTEVHHIDAEWGEYKRRYRNQINKMDDIERKICRVLSIDNSIYSKNPEKLNFYLEIFELTIDTLSLIQKCDSKNEPEINENLTRLKRKKNVFLNTFSSEKTEK